MVGLSGLEPLTSRLSGVRSNQLSYRPMIGAGGRTRTDTRLPPADFESATSANYVTPAILHYGAGEGNRTLVASLEG